MPRDRERLGEVLAIVAGEDFLARGQREFGPLLVRQRADLGGRGAEVVVAQHRSLRPLPLCGGQRDDADVLDVVADVAAVDLVVEFPEAAVELQAHLAGGHVGIALHGLFELGGEVRIHLLEHGHGNGAQAEVRFQGAQGAGLEVLALDRDLVLAVADLRDLGAVADEMAHLALEGLGDLVHAAHRLQHGGLAHDVVDGAVDATQLGFQQVAEAQRVRFHAGLVAGPGVDLVAAAVGAAISQIVAVEIALVDQVFQQQGLVLGAQRLVHLAVADGLGQQFVHVAPHVRLDLEAAQPLARQRAGVLVIDVGGVVVVVVEL